MTLTGDVFAFTLTWCLLIHIIYENKRNFSEVGRLILRLDNSFNFKIKLTHVYDNMEYMCKMLKIAHGTCILTFFNFRFYFSVLLRRNKMTFSIHCRLFWSDGNYSKYIFFNEYTSKFMMYKCMEVLAIIAYKHMECSAVQSLNIKYCRQIDHDIL